MARRAVPVQREGHVLEAHDRADLLLPDVVRPAPAVAALGAGDRREQQDGAVDLVGVEPVVDAGTEQDHAAALGVDRVLRPLPREPDDLGGGHPGVLLLPRGRRRHGRVVVAAGVGLATRGQVPGRPARSTPYWASSRSSTVVTTRSPTRATGTPRRSWTTLPSAPSKRGSSTSTASRVPPWGRGTAERGVDVTEVEVPPARHPPRRSGRRSSRAGCGPRRWRRR